jgi:hypothetical protein
LTRELLIRGRFQHCLLKKNGGTLERAANTANHASTRTTQYSCAAEVTLDEVGRILVFVRDRPLLLIPSTFADINIEHARSPWLRAFTPDFIMRDGDTIFDNDSRFVSIGEPLRFVLRSAAFAASRSRPRSSMTQG